MKGYARVSVIAAALSVVFPLDSFADQASQLKSYAFNKTQYVHEFAFRITESTDTEAGIQEFEIDITSPPSRESLPYGGKLLGNYLGSSLEIIEGIPNAAFTVSDGAQIPSYVSFEAGFSRVVFALQEGTGIVGGLPFGYTGRIQVGCDALIFCESGGTILVSPEFDKRLPDRLAPEYTKIFAAYAPLGTPSPVSYAYTGTFNVTFEIGHVYEVLDTRTQLAKTIGLSLLDTYQKQQAIHKEVKAWFDLTELLGIALAPTDTNTRSANFKKFAIDHAAEEIFSATVDIAVKQGGGQSYPAFFGEFIYSITDQVLDSLVNVSDKANPLKVIEIALLIPEGIHAAFGAAGQWLLNDPPDANFKEVFDVYTSFDYRAFQSGDQLLDDYVQNSLLSAASIAGMVIAHERHLGALEAGDLEWATIQFDEAQRNYDLSVSFAQAADLAKMGLLETYGDEAIFGPEISAAEGIAELKLLLDTEDLTPEQRETIEAFIARFENFEFDKTLTFKDVFPQVGSMHNVVLAAAVPEPSTYAMMAAGLMLVSAWARRRKLH